MGCHRTGIIATGGFLAGLECQQPQLTAGELETGGTDGDPKDRKLEDQRPLLKITRPKALVKSDY